jgi:hypothetical protein
VNLVPRKPTSVGRPIKLRPADPFDLIRWLARSQSDPRKAVAELVQNSLDAGARHVRIDRRRLKRSPSLVVWDDGEGVLPELGREEALRYIAEHIGHSRKMKLTPAERRDRIVAGKYGVGLLGFWAIGQRFELRSRVGGSGLFALRLVEDQEGGQIVELPLRTDARATFTEVVVFDVHEAAMRPLGGARLASYLGSELRGQLLARDIELAVFDGVARGLAQKHFEVRPRRFVGERLELPLELAVEGYGAMRVELFLARGETRPAVQIGCGGTVVADSAEELAALGLEGEPWVGRDLSGILDFPDFAVPPGTRRGVVPDEAARRFVEAVNGRLRALVEAELERFAAERQAAVRRDVARELRRVLRGLSRRLPHYALPEVDHGDDRAPGERTPRGAGLDGSDGEAPVSDAPAESPPPAQPELFPPGPLAAVRIAPDVLAIPCGGERRVHAVATDGAGRRLREGVAYAWQVTGAGLGLRGEGPRPAIFAASDALVGAGGWVTVVARQAERHVEAGAEVVVVEEDASGTRLGVPEPDYVTDPAGRWRTRFDGRRWEVNDAHEDFVALRAEPRTRLRYLLTLFAKEIAQRAFGLPGADTVLEGMVEVLAHAERNLGRTGSTPGDK